VALTERPGLTIRETWRDEDEGATIFRHETTYPNAGYRSVAELRRELRRRNKHAATVELIEGGVRLTDKTTFAGYRTIMEITQRSQR
jgi:hypothetical protein